MKFKRTIGTIMLALVLVGNCVYAQYTTKEEVTNVELRIAELENEYNTCEENLGKAHNLANSARDLGLSEDDEIIKRAQGIYADNENKKVAIQNELEELRARRIELDSKKKLEYIGDFRLTGYCSCRKCCGPYGGTTKSGAKPQEGVTIAADTRVLPLGTRVYIEGVGERVVQDIGGAVKGNKIDVYVSSHSACYRPEINTTSKVYIVS